MQNKGFLVKFYNDDMTINRKMSCETHELTIGRGLFNSIRLQYPSINEIHAIINAIEKKIKPLGPDVFINDKLCIEDSGNIFEYGDIIKLHKLRISICELDDTKIERGNEILACPKQLEYLIQCSSIGSQVEIQPNLYILKSENKSNFETSNMKTTIIADDKNLMTDKDKNSTYSEHEKNELNGENDKDGKNSPFSSEMINGKKDSLYKPMEKNTNLDDTFNTAPEKIVNNNENEQVKMETKVIGNIVDGEKNSKKETLITTEIKSNYFIDQGIIYQKVTENVNVEQHEEINIPLKEDTQSLNTSIQDMTSFNTLPQNGMSRYGTFVEDHILNNDTFANQDILSKNKPEYENVPITDTDVQTAVKLIDANSSESKIEEALEEGNLNVVKEAIINQKDLLNEEIKESIQNIITDIPADPQQNKKINIDLGEAVIEKDILNGAEEKLQQTLEKNYSSSQFSEINSKPVLETGELTKLIDETSEKSTETVFINENQPKNPFFDQTNSDSVEQGKNEMEKREMSISTPSPKRTKLNENISQSKEIEKIEEDKLKLGISGENLKKVDLNNIVLADDKLEEKNLCFDAKDTEKDNKISKNNNNSDSIDLKNETINENANESETSDFKETPAILNKGVKKIDDQKILSKKNKNDTKLKKEKKNKSKKESDSSNVNSEEPRAIVNQDIKKIDNKKIIKKKSNGDKVENSDKNNTDKKFKGKSEDLNDVEAKNKKNVGFDNLTVQVDNDESASTDKNPVEKPKNVSLNKDVEKVKEDLKKKSKNSYEKKSKSVSKLTTTPRAARKASMVNNDSLNIPVSNSKRSKRNVTSRDDTKKSKK